MTPGNEHTTDPVDLFIIGGGINGCGIARDAAGRGFSVTLAEKDDLASGTSSASTKLIHGGLRYLEHYEFRLVRESLIEREVLWGMAPHIIQPMRFVLPHHKGLRPKWLLRLGLFLYDSLGGRKKLPPTATRDLATDPLGKVLRPGHGTAFEYSDCTVDDSRLVVLNARDAATRGAMIRTRTKVTSAQREGAVWRIELTDQISGAEETVFARMLVNAAGPWVEQTFKGQPEAHAVRLVKGSHIVVRKLYDDPRSFFFQNADGRIIFAIPYKREFTLIGTTDADFAGNPGDAEISEGETDYLIAAANEYFATPIVRGDIVWTYSGVRPLYDDGASKAQEATRDYVLKLTGEAGVAPLLTVIGGKITTYRRLSEEALGHVQTALGARGGDWTAGAGLPGGDFAVEQFGEKIAQLQRDYPFLSESDSWRLVHSYGTEAWAILGNATDAEALGRAFGAGLYAAEVDFLIEREWVRTVEDVLWRRSKLGLHGEQIDSAALDAYIAAALDRSGTKAAIAQR
ncbi:MAG TPA: glycerol-3-phosphate dehydrogenase [Pelagibacterium sp.]|uniref:glycerol-3-phosphate dehydrogenase n=1 Tax=Pelagibacterium sp. TaxID=1967288 RepID=UPI002B8E9C3D|nr:glycerol-3-phosphate dehydrogenase [Pelagibacterium sp.]HWJ87400.1 glycerol-3-phosphate dehydrogenase [Pelagibacterium sp.]